MVNKFFIFLALLFSFLGKAQDYTLITKQKVIDEVVKSNNSIKISNQNILASKGDYNQTRAVFLPNISISYTGTFTTNPLMAFGSKLNQEVLKASDFNPDLLNNPDEVRNFATKIEVQQPIFNLDGIYKRKAAKLSVKATELQSDYAKNYILLEVEKAYMQLQLAHKSMSVLRQALKTALENKRLASNALKQGFLQKVDILNIDIRVLDVKNKLQSSESNIANASDYLAVLMNKKSSDIMKPSEELEISLVKINDNNSIKNRADIKAMNTATEAYAKMYKSDKMAFLPRLNAFGTYELYDRDIFSAEANGYLVGLQLKWNLLEGAQRFGKKQKSRAVYEKSKLELEQYIAKSNLELSKAKRMLLDAKNKLKLTELALAQSKESLRIRTNRFKAGLEKTTDLLMAETQLSKKQLEYYKTVFQYNYAHAYLDFLSK